MPNLKLHSILPDLLTLDPLITGSFQLHPLLIAIYLPYHSNDPNLWISSWPNCLCAVPTGWEGLPCLTNYKLTRWGKIFIPDLKIKNVVPYRSVTSALRTILSSAFFIPGWRIWPLAQHGKAMPDSPHLDWGSSPHPCPPGLGKPHCFAWTTLRTDFQEGK